jgi:large subunit ribosomal protein L4
MTTSLETKLFSIKSEQEKKQAIGLIHRVYLNLLKNKRKYLASTKTKSEVRGGGRKPWRQKGTGRARAGSIRSPLWVGGGVIFGPKPRKVYKKINKKEKKLATSLALFFKQKQIVSVPETDFSSISEIKTKTINDYLVKLNIEKNKKILFVLKQPNKFFWLSTRNIKNIEVTTISSLNLIQLLKVDYVILSKESLKLIDLE